MKNFSWETVLAVVVGVFVYGLFKKLIAPMFGTTIAAYFD